jgi:hypothetical protein
MTAEEFLIENYEVNYADRDIVEVMVKFAKIKVEEALICAAGKVMLSNDVYDYVEGVFSPDEWFDKESILNAYPLENIK